MSHRPVIQHLCNATVVSGKGSAVAYSQQTVVLNDDRIEWVGPIEAAPQRPEGTIVHDLSNKFLLPGFMDCHVHLWKMKSTPAAQLLEEPAALAQYKSVANMAATLDAGVTMVRDMSGVDYSAVLAVERGYVRGPNLIVAISAIGPTGGHSDSRALSVPFGQYGVPGLHPNIADSPQEAVKVARELIRLGAGVIKVMATGGVWSPRDAPEDIGLRVPEMAVIVEEARIRGLFVAAHAQGAEGIKNALRAGVKSIEHGYLIDDEGIELMLEHDAYLVPTLLSGTTPPDPARATPYAFAKKNKIRAQLQENVAKAIAAGVNVALGTDSGVAAHGQNLKELGLMVDLGLSPARALAAGTSEAAYLLGQEAERGTIEAGKIADLVVTAVNPLSEIHGLGNPAAILTVFQSGEMVKS